MTHLVAADCIGCGRFTYAIPERADDAMCVGCWRQACGALDPPAIEPPYWTLRPAVAGGPPRRTDRAARVSDGTRAALLFPVRCSTCGWRSRAPDYVTGQVMARVHHHVRHDPAGWASGVAGGLSGGARRPNGTSGARNTGY